MRKQIIMLLATLGLGATTAAVAHHSAAMFDPTKSVTIEGTVKEMKWTNPHSWLFLVVDGGSGKAPVEYSIEFGSPNHLYRQGLRPTDLKAGDRIKVTMAPLRDGGNGGQFRTMILPNGQPFGKSALEL